MEVGRPEPGNSDDALYAVLQDFLESVERGVGLEPATLIERHPEIAPELKEFFDTWVRVQGITAPLRSASQVLREAASSGDFAISGGDAPVVGVTPVHAAAATGAAARADRTPTGRPRDAGDSWLGDWLRRHPPLAAEFYPFLKTARPEEEIGRLGPYRLFEVVGSGGMGVVFRGEDVALRRPVAVKVLRAELAAEPAFRERFLREARSAAALDHEHVVSVYHVGEDGGIPFLGMQWLRGVSLEELLRHTWPLGVPVVLRLGRQVALGLAAAHGQGLLHRDIKPANLWIEHFSVVPALPASSDVASAGRVKILDFGLARALGEDSALTHVGTTVGTPAYMAPEQAAGGPVDARCDLFALGVVLYRMCSGRLPFPARSTAAANRAATEPPLPLRDLNPAVPAELDDLVMQLLARDPAGRPASAAEVAARLRTLEGRESLPATVAALPATVPSQPAAVASPLPPLPGSPRRRRSAVLAMALAVLLWVGYLLGGSLFTRAFLSRQGHKEAAEVARQTPPAGATAVPATFDADRAAALWVLESGGKVKVQAGDQQREVVNIRSLPGGAFRVVLVDMTGTAADDAGLAHLEPLEELHYLRLTRTPVGDAGLAHLAGLKSLQNLLVDQTKVTDAGLASISGLTDLTNVDICYTAVTDAGLAHLAPLKNLVHLHLCGTRVSDAGLQHLQPMTGLRVLSLYSTRVTDAGLPLLRPLTELEALYLDGLPVTDAGLVHLDVLKKLRTLNLGGTQVTDVGLAHLQEMTELEELDLRNTRVTDVGVRRLGGLKNLFAVNLGCPCVTDAGLEFIGTLTKLRYLRLDGSHVTDAGLAHLEKLTKLDLLNLAGLPVTEAGLAHLSGATGLRLLNLSKTRVNDASIKAIISANWPLTFLDLSDTRVSGKGYSTLKTTYPEARILWSEPNWSVARDVLAVGGTVWVRPVGHLEETAVRKAVDLPGESFMVTHYRLPAGGKVPEGLPTKLAALTDPHLDGLRAADFSGGPCDLKSLKHLLPATVNDLNLSDARVGDEDLVHLPALGLKRLNLDGCPIQGNGLVHLKAVPELARGLIDLSLARTHFSDSQMGQLKAFPRLRRLDVSGCPVRGPGLAALKEMPELRELVLACPTLTDVFAEELGILKQLERLSLANSGLTDEGAAHLRGLTNLHELDLTGTKVTSEGAAALQKELPKCKVRCGPAGSR
jgi:serine/threonine protein kinase/Leucine-rich repeat (LRR) protein